MMGLAALRLEYAGVQLQPLRGAKIAAFGNITAQMAVAIEAVVAAGAEVHCLGSMRASKSDNSVAAALFYSKAAKFTGSPDEEPEDTLVNIWNIFLTFSPNLILDSDGNATLLIHGTHYSNCLNFLCFYLALFFLLLKG